MRAAREIHAQRAETADEVLIQLDTIASRDIAALAQLERAGSRTGTGGLVLLATVQRAPSFGAPPPLEEPTDVRGGAVRAATSSSLLYTSDAAAE